MQPLFKQLSLEQIDAYIDALHINAAQLIKEAKALHAIEAFARAFSLAHFAREELSKAAMLSAAATRLLAQHPVDWKSLEKRMRDHKAKLRLEIIEMALLMKGAGHEEQSDKLLSGLAAAVANTRNDSKNDSLYVGFSEGKVTLPSDTRSGFQALRTIALAEMRYADLAFRRKHLGPYAARPIGSIQMEDWDNKELDDATLKAVTSLSVYFMSQAGAESSPEHQDAARAADAEEAGPPGK